MSHNSEPGTRLALSMMLEAGIDLHIWHVYLRPFGTGATREGITSLGGGIEAGAIF